MNEKRRFDELTLIHKIFADLEDRELIQMESMLNFAFNLIANQIAEGDFTIEEVIENLAEGAALIND